MSPSASPATKQITLPDIERGLSCRRIEDAIQAPTMSMVKNAVGYGQTLVTVSKAVTAGMAYFAPNRRMSDGAIGMFAEELIEQYPHESVADVALFMQNAAKGRYGRKGEEGETFGQLDMQRLFIWFGQYLEEKAAMLERGEHLLQQQAEAHAKAIVTAHPGLKETVAEFVISAKEASDLAAKRTRLAKLERQLPDMTDDAMREAWKLYRTAEERSLIQAEAARRGLLGDDVKAAQLEIDNPQQSAA